MPIASTAPRAAGVGRNGGVGVPRQADDPAVLAPHERAECVGQAGMRSQGVGDRPGRVGGGPGQVEEVSRHDHQAGAFPPFKCPSQFRRRPRRGGRRRRSEAQVGDDEHPPTDLDRQRQRNDLGDLGGLRATVAGLGSA